MLVNGSVVFRTVSCEGSVVYTTASSVVSVDSQAASSVVSVDSQTASSDESGSWNWDAIKSLIQSTPYVPVPLFPKLPLL